MTQCIRSCHTFWCASPVDFIEDDEECVELGHGTFSKIWEVKDTQTNQSLALKVFKPLALLANISPKTEYQLHKDCSDHPNIIRVLELYKDQIGRHCMSMEKGRIDLFDWLVEQDELSEARLHSIFSQVVASVSHLHGKKIVHRDIKLGNYILMDDEKTLKLTDFGFAKRIQGKGPHTPRGTLFYKSPEMAQKQHFDWATDHWSMGVLLYELAYFQHLSDSAAEYNIRQSPPLFPKGRSKELEDLIQKLLNQNPDQRLGKGSPCCQEILEHPWMKKYSS